VPRRIPLAAALAARQPPVDDPEDAVLAGLVEVDGAVVLNPRSQVRSDARIIVREPKEPRGVRKLGFALDAWSVEVAGKACLDLGACTGGFTTALLDRGARVVYAVDVGHGQLLGSLRQDPRVVNLERTNLSEVTPARVPEPVELLVADITNLALGQAVAQVTAALSLPDGAELVALVKPMFELGWGELPTSADDLADALGGARAGVEGAGWRVLGDVESPMRGSGGAVEFFLRAVREK
jgi:23S rRNA (cytidine1920-2'-O)/16S rRNA (cytidine1409-2'-O)-methyltransferase